MKSVKSIRHGKVEKMILGVLPEGRDIVSTHQIYCDIKTFYEVSVLGSVFSRALRSLKRKGYIALLPSEAYTDNNSPKQTRRRSYTPRPRKGGENKYKTPRTFKTGRRGRRYWYAKRVRIFRRYVDEETFKNAHIRRMLSHKE